MHEETKEPKDQYDHNRQSMISSPGMANASDKDNMDHTLKHDYSGSEDEDEAELEELEDMNVNGRFIIDLAVICNRPDFIKNKGDEEAFLKVRVCVHICQRGLIVYDTVLRIHTYLPIHHIAY